MEYLKRSLTGLKKIYNIFVTLLITFCFTSSALSSPWILKEGDLRVQIGGAYTDFASRRQQKERHQIFINATYGLRHLIEEKNLILQTQTREDRPLRNSEKAIIAGLKKEINDIKKLLEMMKSFNDDYLANIYFEYGIGNLQAIGGKLSYSHENSFLQGDIATKKVFSFHHKYNFYNHRNYSASIKSEINLSNRGKDYYSNFGQVAILLGQSKTKNGRSSYYSYGISFKKFWSHKVRKDFGYTLLASNGFELKNGVNIDNYAEYQYLRGSNKVYNDVVYLQTTASKKIHLKRLNLPPLTLQIGYFWKKSLVVKHYSLSGPTISVWFSY